MKVEVKEPIKEVGIGIGSVLKNQNIDLFVLVTLLDTPNNEFHGVVIKTPSDNYMIGEFKDNWIMNSFENLIEGTTITITI